MAPTLGTGVSSLPPEGACPALGRPDGWAVAPSLEDMAPTLGTGVSSLPPEGACPALGRPGGWAVASSLEDVAPTLLFSLACHGAFAGGAAWQ